MKNAKFHRLDKILSLMSNDFFYLSIFPNFPSIFLLARSWLITGTQQEADKRVKKKKIAPSISHLNPHQKGSLLALQFRIVYEAANASFSIGGNRDPLRFSEGMLPTRTKKRVVFADSNCGPDLSTDEWVKLLLLLLFFSLLCDGTK